MGTIRPRNRITRRELLRGAATEVVALALHGDRSAFEGHRSLPILFIWLPMT